MRTFVYIIPVITILTLVVTQVERSLEMNFYANDNTALPEAQAIYQTYDRIQFRKTGQHYLKQPTPETSLPDEHIAF